MPLPEYRARELIQNVGIVRAGNTGEGLRRFGLGVAEAGFSIGEAEDRKRKLAETAYIADIEVRNREKIAEISAQTRYEPERFRNLAQGHIDGVLSTVPEHLKPRVSPSLRAQAVSEYGQSLDRVAEQERRLQLDAVQSNMNSYIEKYQALADSGMGGSDEAVKVRGKISDMGMALVDGGFKSRVSVANALKALDEENYGRTVLAHNQETFRKQGFGAAWKELHDIFSTDETLKQSKSRSKLLNSGQEFLREQTAALNRVDEMSERAIRRGEQATAKTAWELLEQHRTAGTLPAFGDWLNKNWRGLPLDEAKALRNAIKKPDPESDDLDAINLIDDAFRNRDDARPLITSLHAQGRLKTSTAQSYIEKNREAMFKRMPESPYEMSVTSLLDSFDPGLFKMDVDSKGRRRAAVERFQLEFDEERTRRERANESPMTQKEIFELRDSVKQRFVLQEWDTVSRLFETPRFMVGNRSEMNIDATEAATVRAFREGRISSVEAERQAVLLTDWRRAMSRRAEVSEKKKK